MVSTGLHQVSIHVGKIALPYVVGPVRIMEFLVATPVLVLLSDPTIARDDLRSATLAIGFTVTVYVFVFLLDAYLWHGSLDIADWLG